MKKCRKCNQIKPYSEFYKGKRYSDGYRTWCKSCMDSESLKNLAIARIKKRKDILCFCGTPIIMRYHAKKYCSDNCAKEAYLKYVKEFIKKKANTPEYRKWHREYMRKKLNIDQSKYRIT